jgi:polysaccharide biosynthesis/export protein
MTRKMTFLYLLVSALFLLGQTACLRYVPSRSELAGSREQAQYGGEQAFYSLEQNQEQRLGALVSERHAERSANAQPSYKVGVGDVLEFSVFEVPELNLKARVRPSGDVALPLIGSVTAVGKTEAQIQEDVRTKLLKFVYTPQVQVFIAEYQANKVWVIGEIHKPGAYPLIRDNYSLIELLAEAGGRTEKAGSLVVLIPQSAAATAVQTETPGAEKLAAPPQPTADTPTQTETSNAEKPAPLPQTTAATAALTEASEAEKRARLAQAHNQNGIEIYFDDLVGSVNKPPLSVPLRPGDAIVVPEAGMVQVDGEVNKPGSYPLASRMTLLGAIASATGLNYSADVKKVEVVRELGAGQKALITVDLEKIALREGTDIRLRDGDVVRVPSAAGRFATRQAINIVNGFLGRLVPPF